MLKEKKNRSAIFFTGVVTGLPALGWTTWT